MADDGIDIRQEAKKIDAAIEVFFELGDMVELRRCILLQEYIHVTWMMEQQLEARADYIQVELHALGETLRDLHISMRRNRERDEPGGGSASD